ncbi:MAG: DNA repair protein RadA [Gammaproteobacteria bacterium PRO9]|nr:DNA repair protein RadA [Gammaproteobacteria bacterium PRO9]
MSKTRKSYHCAECGAVTPKWQGQCPACGAWNALEPVSAAMPVPAAGTAPALVQRLAAVGTETLVRLSTGLTELDRTLGGGLVPGSVVLLGGDPGIGKSTLLLQAATRIVAPGGALYASGEESLQQISLRGQRLGADLDAVAAIATTRVDEVIEAVAAVKPACLIVDSIQTMATDLVPSAPGSPNQLRSSAGMLVRLAKQSGIAVILVGHVTKDGQIAGPRLLEHMVDVVLYFESEAGSRYRILRAVKNRFGAANELGIFVMAEGGIREVRNPSALFVSRQGDPVPGSVVTALHQGSRPLLVEVQALADQAGGGPPRRVAIGLEANRLTLLLAALHRHGGIATHASDIFVNVVGGVRVLEPAADLAALVAAVSSIRDRPLARDLVVFGEVGLAGEIRPVAYGAERLREAANVGFRRALVARANAPRDAIAGLTVIAVDNLREVMRLLPGLEAQDVGSSGA